MMQNFSKKNIKPTVPFNIGLFQKKKKKTGGVEDMEFSGVLKK